MLVLRAKYPLKVPPWHYYFQTKGHKKTGVDCSIPVYVIKGSLII